MEKSTSNHSNNGRPPGRADPLETLFSHASTRPEPSENTRRRVRRTVHDEWRTVASKRRWRVRVAALSVAAVVALVVTVLVMDTTRMSPSTALIEMARVERVSGHVRVLAGRAGGDGAPLAFGMPVYLGQSLQTGEDSGIAVRLASGESLRLDQDSNLRFVAAHRVALETGRVYMDTEIQRSRDLLANPSGREFAIITARGAVRHIGTQYMVRVADSHLRVSVREGRVQFTADHAQPTPLYVSTGEELSVGEQGAPVLAESGPGDEKWRWAEALGPGFVLDGRTMDEFLDWVARETGNEIVYQTEEAKSVAEETRLHGTVDLPAREALNVVLSTSDLSADIGGGGVIEISLER